MNNQLTPTQLKNMASTMMSVIHKGTYYDVVVKDVNFVKLIIVDYSVDPTQSSTVEKHVYISRPLGRRDVSVALAKIINLVAPDGAIHDDKLSMERPILSFLKEWYIGTEEVAAFNRVFTHEEMMYDSYLQKHFNYAEFHTPPEFSYSNNEEDEVYVEEPEENEEPMVRIPRPNPFETPKVQVLDKDLDF